MSADGHNTIADVTAPQADLMHLCRAFAAPGFVGECRAMRPGELPEPSRRLLVHQAHMTIELERHHGRPVDVRVIRENLEDQTYTRLIGLNLRGTDRIVEWGICRLDLKYLSAAVRAEILAKAKPLGAILIAHQVYRRIEPRHYVQFAAASPVIGLFGAYNDNPVYGRLGIIHCDDEPAIELLEIVVNTEVKDT